ncbi:conserved hypothetical protein, putative Mu-like prophage protein [Sulfurovum sp. enrichment culture clone C5]|uniref:Mu-like prophage I protein n=1 Tax=Sulfurovum sp. enrichment culture clone C5 TaxID=497650 RepID=A0A0S4XM84_9BACT|nr:conserved hypothetical protein, putative Mu-like prophage protein [Sulfurovum sp. enrichment culture clone C5]
MKLKKGLKLNFKQGEKVMVSPVGEVIGLDGRGFIIDGDKLLADIQKNEIDIVLDANHNFDKALGWFPWESFEKRDDGIYASLDLTPAGIESNDRKEYRYLSPVFMMCNDREVGGLDSVGFVNRPNLLNNALNDKQKEQNNMTLEELKAEFDTVSKTVSGLTENLKTATDQLTTIATNIATVETNTKAHDNKFATIEAEMLEVNKKLQIFGKGGDYENNNNNGDLSDSEKATAKMLGLSDDEYKLAKGDK